jgi:hypothetical protein
VKWSITKVMLFDAALGLMPVGMMPSFTLPKLQLAPPPFDVAAFIEEL